MYITNIIKRVKQTGNVPNKRHLTRGGQDAFYACSSGMIYQAVEQDY